MKTFFTQPIGQLGRQNSLGFIGINVVLLVVFLRRSATKLAHSVRSLWHFVAQSTRAVFPSVTRVPG